jgi:hypothetical protein
MINRLTGVRQRTVWSRGFDDPIILTVDKVIHFIKYIYKNAANANLVSSIEQYPGNSSWQMFRTKQYEKNCIWIRREAFYKINSLHCMNERELNKLVLKLAGETPKYHNFVLEPDAWISCFDEFKDIEPDTINQKIINEILDEERHLEHPTGVLGVSKLKTQHINKTYKPDKFGKRMICICSDINLRIRFIKYFTTISEQAKEAYKRIKYGICDVLFPPGMFMPGGKLLKQLPKKVFMSSF